MTTGIGTLRVAAVLLVGSLGLSACATKEYVDQRIDEVNTHITAVEAKADAANQKADAAMGAAQAAQSTATQDSQRIDQLSTQMNSYQQQPAPRPRTPRG
ncbi:MAG TPA: alanine-zipper protein [Caulobacteraceae bacterium]|jgi:outer membrane murein-binding lipoprotein Lpp